MLKTILFSLAALVVLAAIVGGIILGAKSVTVPVTQPQFQVCLDTAEANHRPPVNCPKTETLWDRGFDDPVAYYTFWLALFTIALAIGALVQSVLVGRQISLARAEFLASHRPKIRVRAVDFDGKLSNGDNLVVNFTCVNIGDSPCEVVGASYIFSVTEKAASPTKRKKMSNIELPKPIKLAAGEPAKFTTHAVNGEEARMLGGNWDFWGMIQYRDTSGVMRLTGFWRRFEARTNDFTAPDNPDFNYEY